MTKLISGAMSVDLRDKNRSSFAATDRRLILMRPYLLEYADLLIILGSSRGDF